MDLQLCLDFFAIITYISDYYSKDDTGTMCFIKDALKRAENESLKTKLALVVSTFLTHRQIGESEAFFKILPHLEMKSSNIKSVFIPTGFKSNRSQFLRQITDIEMKNCPNVIQIDNRDGYYIEAPSLLDKYQRRDISRNIHLQNLTYLQFCMKYSTTNSEPKEGDFHSVEYLENQKGWKTDNEMDLIITHDFNNAVKHFSLPNFIGLHDILLGEPKFMKKHSCKVVRVHKINSTKHPHEYRFSQLQMYRPFLKEDEFGPDNIEMCDLLFHEKSQYNQTRKIQNVKSIHSNASS